ncbi:MAG: tryptophanase [Flavobacteriales bacterium]|nr:tryptophanase [Flavobacteriales bacterium]MBT5133268.1 tryptophanase [Flavobacteriales bacterium]MBT7748357.1 tryptophanase [Flavobacteriales bacterium]
MYKTIIEPFKIKMVEPIAVTNEEQRIEFLEAAHYNPFQLDADSVMIDFLTDSGTSAMSAEQWSGIMRGDEAYAGSRSWQRMEEVVKKLTGFEFVLPTHQGRAAERIIYSALGGEGKTFISNTHFDTTRANIEFTGSEAIDIPIPEGTQPQSLHPFKGNMDVTKLRSIIEERGGESIGAVILTVTNNSGGGQPVSMSNAKDIRSICDEFDILFLLDCCRVAENAYFIREREDGYSELSYKQIAEQMFRLTDGAVMSAKKDGLVNMGGFLALKNKELAVECTNVLIITEGFSTYGGLSGRDMEAIAIGLEEVFDEKYLEYRMKSTKYLGDGLEAMGVPLLLPVGGHAVYIDAARFYPQIPAHEYPGQALACQLYLKGGIRAVEIGSVMFGKYDEQGELIPSPMELVRLAIPRRVYTQSHIEYVLEVFRDLKNEKNEISGYKITEEPRFLRHFTAHFEPLKGRV